MKRLTLLAACAVALCWYLASERPAPVQAQQASRAQWIWHPEADAPKGVPVETRYFRKVFSINRPVQNPVDEAVLDITVADNFTVWVNGAQVGKGDNWKRVYAFDVRKHLVHGKNVVAVQASNSKRPAGLLARLSYVPNGQSKHALVSDSSWKATKEVPKGWQEVEFKDSGWKPVSVIGPYGTTPPWKTITWDSGGDDRFSVPPGFKVELAVKQPAKDAKFSLVNMCFDAKGRLLVSRENGAILLCTEPDKDGVLQKVAPYCTQVTNCQGMCWVKDALLLVGNGPAGTGLYRCRDTDGDDKIDDVKLLHKFKGGMAEHGPHAIIHGPDDWLYLVVGNHAWAQIGPEPAKNAVNPPKLAANSPLLRWPTGGMGPDQGKPGTTEDVLLPRLNDGRGHAANILAPGGTIWRLDHDGKNMALVAAGFRNHFDAAFSPTGELFTFDSDMEWDEALPWYRPVRVCHCPPGADFVWRTGAANTPDYYIDSLPPIAETGRGSPVGVEFYDHYTFPKQYRGAVFMADWAIGVIFAVHLERSGASYKTKVERFCSGAPMNVTDLAVGPDGALYLTMGGRDTHGGVYRIAYTKPVEAPFNPRPTALPKVKDALLQPQPFAPWARDVSAYVKTVDKSWSQQLGEIAKNPNLKDVEFDPKSYRLRALDLLQLHGPRPGTDLARSLAADKDADIRARAVWLLGVNGGKGARNPLVKALKDADALVRRRACEALIRAQIEPPVNSVWPLLGDKDRFVRHAARLVLERIEPQKWADKIAKEPNDLIAWNGIIALFHTNSAKPYAEKIFERLRGAPGGKGVTAQDQLDWLRTVQMALVHTTQRPIWVGAVARECQRLFPQKDWRVNRELAILLVHFQIEKQLDQPPQAKLLKALLDSKSDRQQQIHYAYCLRLLKDGWTPQQKGQLAAWYDTTKTWSGGHSFVPFLANIFRDALPAYALADRKQLLAKGDAQPLPALVLAQKLQTDRQPELLLDLNDLSKRLAKFKGKYRHDELQQTVTDALCKTAAANPKTDHWPYLVRGLESRNPLIRAELFAALQKLPDAKPKADDPTPYRTLLVAAGGWFPKERWQAVELLRQWSGRSFGAAAGKPDKELELWGRWFVQTFPKEPPLPNTAAVKAAESKYKFDELLKYLENDGKTGDVARGRIVFEKAQCLKCHKFGREGEGVGPDLTALAKRFKRSDTLDAILNPSKVISDQYRSVTITTTGGVQITGLAAVQGDTVTVLLNDASKITLKRSDIESQVASLVSVMPDRLLDPLTLQEIADLFAFMESEAK